MLNDAMNRFEQQIIEKRHLLSTLQVKLFLSYPLARVAYSYRSYVQTQYASEHEEMLMLAQTLELHKAQENERLTVEKKVELIRKRKLDKADEMVKTTQFLLSLSMFQVSPHQTRLRWTCMNPKVPPKKKIPPKKRFVQKRRNGKARSIDLKP